MSEPEMDPPTMSLADANDAEADHCEREGEWMREQRLTPPRASAVPARVTKVLALNDLTLAEAQRMDDDELTGIPQMGPASLAYIRSTSAPPIRDQSVFMAAFARFQTAINTRWGSGR